MTLLKPFRLGRWAGCLVLLGVIVWVMWWQSSASPVAVKEAKPTETIAAVLEPSTTLSLQPGDYGLVFDASCKRHGYKYVTNPSVLVLGERMLVAARALYVTSQRDGHPFDTWHSDIVLAELPLHRPLAQALAIPLQCKTLPLFAPTSLWRNRTCQYSFWSGNTHAYGPEDPKLFVMNNRMQVLFGSRPLGTPQACEQASNQDVIFQQFFFGLDSLTLEDPTGQRPSSTTLEPAYFPLPIVYQPRHALDLMNPPRREMQKNFAPFVFQGRLHVSYSLDPHLVLAVDKDGRVLETYTATSNIFSSLVPKFGTIEVRGNTPAVLVNVHSLFGPDVGPEFVYLSVMHFQSPSGYGYYFHFAYTFSASPPFTILGLSCELPLRKKARFYRPGLKPQVAYAAGLAVVGEKVLISYGSGDSEARVYVAELKNLRVFPHQQNQAC